MSAELGRPVGEEYGKFCAQPKTTATALMIACGEGHLTVSRKLLPGKQIVSNAGGDGDTPLHFACMNGGSKDLAARLLASGAELDRPNGRGETPLHKAAQTGGDLVHLLVSAGAAVDRKDASGETPLMHAVRHGRADACSILLSAGVNVDCATGSGESALKIAMELEHDATVACLMQWEPSLDFLSHSDVVWLYDLLCEEIDEAEHAVQEAETDLEFKNQGILEWCEVAAADASTVGCKRKRN